MAKTLNGKALNRKRRSPLPYSCSNVTESNSQAEDNSDGVKAGRSATIASEIGRESVLIVVSLPEGDFAVSQAVKISNTDRKNTEDTCFIEAVVELSGRR